MKIKLIMTASESEPIYKHNPFMPMPLPLLAAYAPEHEYRIVDLLAGDPINYDEPADLVGISVRYLSEEPAYQIADEFRRRKVPVVMGGPQISAKPFEAIRHADSVVVGEGEQVWPVLLNDVSQKNQKQFYVCSPEPFSAEGYTVHQIHSYLDLKNVRPPLRHLVRQKYVFDTVFASRGCPVDCDFCAVSSLFGKAFRLRPLEDVIAEIKTFKKYYYLIDDTVFGKPSTYDYYLSLYDGIAQLKKRRYWMGQANLDAVADKKGRDVIKKARQAGLIYISIGLESINPVILEKSGAIRKMGVISANDMLEKMKDHIKFIQDLGIIVSGWFVLGYEEDTIDSYYRTYEFCEKNTILPAIFPLNALPGTRLYERLEKEKRIKKTRFSNIYHPALEDDELYQALKYIKQHGYSFKSNLKRTIFYLSRFRNDRIHKTIFLLILMSQFRYSVDVTRNNTFC